MKVVYSARALGGLERILRFADDEHAAPVVMEVITEAIEMLSRHPFLGHPVRPSLRELVISWGRTGYTALYRIRRGQVEILAIRHQREAGYR